MLERSSPRLAAALTIVALATPLPSVPVAGPVPAAGPLPAADIQYPATRTVDVVDDYHGTPVADPYRWLEESDAVATADWVRAQNEVTFAYLESIPERESIHQRLEEISDYPKVRVPVHRGDWYFVSRNDGLQDHDVLYKQRSLDGEAEVLIDPNLLSEDGTTALTSRRFSVDGRYLAYGLSTAGSDWREIRVREVESGRDLPDLLRFVKFSEPSWTLGGEGFFYSRYPEPEKNLYTGPNRNQRLYFHRLGTEQSADLLILERPDHPDWGFGAAVTDDGRYAVISIWQSTAERNRVHVLDLVDPQRPRLDGPVVPLLDDYDAEYTLVGNDGPILFFKTNLDAPRGRVIAIDQRRPARDAWRTILPESDDAMTTVALVGDRFIVATLHDATSRVHVYDLEGRLEREIELPALGRAYGFGGRRADTETFYVFQSYLQPRSIYRYDIVGGESRLLWAPELDLDAGLYVTRQVFYASKDGTRIPMFLTHRRGIERNGAHPTLLYGYGGFNISMTPGFSPKYLVWLELGGVVAIPNLRGGGEYGEDWHAAGTLERKQNVFDDCIAAAEYLIEEGYTRPDRLAIAGHSNGGLLVGAVMTQRPDLFGAALPGAGVLDMLRYHRFTIGWAWASDYGTADDPEGFRYLRAYSPLHNLRPGTAYPATLITAADYDDRVVPAHSFKFAAALQAAQAGPAPTLIRIDVRAGHGAGKPTHKRLLEQADELAFLFRNLGMDPVAGGFDTP